MRKTSLLSTLLIPIALFSLSSCGGSSNRLTIVHFDQSILGEASKELGVSIGLKKGSDELKDAINSVLSEISVETRNEWMLEATERSTLDRPVTVPSQEEVTKFDKTLYVGLECEYAPFNWTEVAPTEYSYPIHGATRQYAAGYDVTVAREIADKLGYNLVIEKMGWDALIPWVQSGDNRIVIAGMTDTEERRLSIDFTDEYYRSELVLVVKEDSPYAKATSLEDFAGARIVSQVSTVTDSVIEDWKTTYNVTHLSALNTFATCATAVVSGAADAMTAELPVATSIVNGANR
ncbi:MAG: transporter substrate-binding domain-containing protein [Bacillales bacterium]|nr:transporter substrate-binding domain-containing protein [Bacillales bacterium]